LPVADYGSPSVDPQREDCPAKQRLVSVISSQSLSDLSLTTAIYHATLSQQY